MSRTTAPSRRRALASMAAIVIAGLGAGCAVDAVAPLSAVTAAFADQRIEMRGPSPAAATLRWNEIARALVARYRTDPAARTYAALGVAQFAAATARGNLHPGSPPDTRAAIAGASAAVLGYLYPAEVTMLDDEVRAQEALDPARFAGDVSAAEAAGRELAQGVIDRLRTDGSDAVWSGTVPTGPGMWVSKGAPVTPLLGQVRPYFLTSGSQLRPPAPPAFGSPEFLAALAEVRSISDTRTVAQTQLAQSWSYSGGTIRMPGYWNVEAAGLITAGGLQEREAALVFALLNTAMMDATIACFDAKYVYWLIRPSQADPRITLGTSLSNHPSYPSSHSCTSGAGAEVLGTLFPDDAARLHAVAAEIGESRIIGGLHYRFDVDVGTRLGEDVARIALAGGRRGMMTVAGR